MIEGDGDARLPGSRRIALREKAARDGVTVDAKLLAEVPGSYTAARRACHPPLIAIAACALRSILALRASVA